MNSISGVGAVTSYKTDNVEARNNSTFDVASQARKTEFSDTLKVQIDKVTQQPVPPRFPWLSRLTAELEAAANQRPTFPHTSGLGNNIDRTA